LGSITALLLAFAVFSALAGPSPVYKFWGDSVGRLTPADPADLWRKISATLFGPFFTIFIAFGLVLLTVALGLTALLRKEV